ncbi:MULTISPECIES: hypothetical protein [Streptomyces]|uniref:Uncharacterized protein n=1 Tax=Streptomyces canarius TaxID=285453 RepID=A0ABQ3CUM5_9ACTN|nr:hypothetical protein [Streptomyces canarius]GHA33566.1 hypothetical protein GCM10010345_42630 [Streptomyces canarius]
MLCTRYFAHQDVTVAAVPPQADRAAALGFGVVIVDDGGQTTSLARGHGSCGDREAAAEKFPEPAGLIADFRYRVHPPECATGAAPAGSGSADRVQQWQQVSDNVPVAAGEFDGVPGRACRPGTVLQVQRIGAAQLAEQGGVQTGHTPALVQSRGRRRAVTPERSTVSAGTSRQVA